jgi:PAS domain S-box-containing protein
MGSVAQKPETKRLEEILRQRSFELVKDPVYITDSNKHIIYANSAASEQTGYTPDEILSKPMPELWGGLMSGEFYHRLWHTIKDLKEPFSSIVKNKKKDGSVYYTRLQIYPLLDSDGEPEFYMGMNFPALEYGDAKKQEDLLDVIAHNIKSPLSAENILLDLLERSGLSEEQKNLFDDIVRSNEQIKKMLQDIFLISSLRKGKDLADLNSTGSLKQVVTYVLDEMQPKVRRKNTCIILEGNMDVPVPVVFLLKKIIENLLSNAIKYGKEGGIITLSIIQEGGEYIFSCKDDGIGIKTKDQEKIFTPFFRAENARKHADGTGMGLYLTKNIAESIGHRIWFSSEKNRGSTFHVAWKYKESPES